MKDSKIVSMTRNYSNYTFTFEDGKNARINLRWGENGLIESVTVYGKTGREIQKNFPDYFPDPYSTIFEKLWAYTDFYRHKFTRKSEELLNRLFAMGFTNSLYPSAIFDNNFFGATIDDWLAANIKDVISVLKGELYFHPDDINPRLLATYKVRINKIFDAINNNDIDDYAKRQLTHSIMGSYTLNFNYDVSLLLKAITYTVKKYQEEHAKLLANQSEAERLYENFNSLIPPELRDVLRVDYRPQKLNTNENNIGYIAKEYVRKISSIKRYAKLLNCKIPSGNPDVQLDYLEKIAKSIHNVDKSDFEFFMVQQRIPFNEFLCNDYTMTIPKSYNECLDIGNEFHNCVGGIEWTNHLSVGKRALVVFRSTSSNEKICCDISVDGSFRVRQFYLPCNKFPYSDRANKLRKDFQAWLDNLPKNMAD